MAKTKISEFSATPANNTDIDSINIAEGCAPSGINDAIRELMAQLKDFQTGAVGDSFNGPVGTTTAAAGAFTTLSASSTVSGTGFSTYLASPPAIGGTAAAAGSFTTLSASGAVTLSGGTANGVAYLNGSKVVTSGSALTFDGTNTLGVNTAGAGSVALGNTASYGVISAGGTNAASIYLNGATRSGLEGYLQSGASQHIWYNGSLSSEYMRLTSTGLGIGTSSPAQKLHVKSSGATKLLINSSDNSADRGVYFASSTDSDVLGYISQEYSTGNFTISAGTGSYSVPMIFKTSGSERARIDSSGNLLVGTTSGTQTLRVVGSKNGDYVGYFANSNGSSPFGLDIVYTALSPNGTTNRFIDCEDTTTARFQVRSNGGIANYQANDVNLSDRREKTNFAPAGEYLSKICAIPVQTFNYIDQNMEEDGGLTLGVVAQDVQAVAPELVMESNWAGKEQEPKMRLSIYQTDLQYALMKCIQEQQAIIESLKARLDAANL